MDKFYPEKVALQNGIRGIIWKINGRIFANKTRIKKGLFEFEKFTEMLKEETRAARLILQR